MRKIVISAQEGNEHTEELVRLMEILFPECEVQVTPPESTDPKKN
jgi:hypothetical protein